MTAQIELPDIFPALKEISQTLKEISSALQTLTYLNQTEWLNASDFCKKYNISIEHFDVKVTEA